MGTGKTIEEAALRFKIAVTDRYFLHVEGKLAGSEKKVGRPKKNFVEFHTQVKPDTKRDISDMAKELGLSQGDIIEFLYKCYLENKEKMQPQKISQELVTLS